MAAGKIILVIDQGETFNKRFEYKDKNNSPIDLTYYQGRMQIRPSKGSSTLYATISSSAAPDGTQITFTPLSGSTILPATSGSFRVIISAYSTSLFTFDEAYADLFIYSGSGITQYADKVFEASIKLNKSVTV